MEAETNLAATLRIWRNRSRPTEIGNGDQRRRRTTGLRREELAELASLSVDYIVRLEQGRATTPSAQVVAALARVFQLNRVERDHFYRLAQLQPPSDQEISDQLSPELTQFLTRLGNIPVAVFTADWRMVWWNHSWAALVGDPNDIVPEERSLVRAHFPIHGRCGRVHAWPVRADNAEATDRAIVADLRRASSRYPGDSHLSQLIYSTLEGNEYFAQLWNAGAVGEHTRDQKTVEHPIVGEIEVYCDVLSPGATDFKIVTLTSAIGSEDARKIERLCLLTTHPE